MPIRQSGVYVRDAYACASAKYRLNVRAHTEYPWQSLFVYNMFLRVADKEQKGFSPDWNVYCFPSVKADPAIHKTRQDNFAIINFTDKNIIIGGTAYTGRNQKGHFFRIELFAAKRVGRSIHALLGERWRKRRYRFVFRPFRYRQNDPFQ